jgi:hypothetical protein
MALELYLQSEELPYGEGKGIQAERLNLCQDVETYGISRVSGT